MNLADAPPIKAVAFTLAIVVGVVGVVLYAAKAHQGASKVTVTSISTESTSTSLSGSATPSSSPTIPAPHPRQIKIGDALCSYPDDYQLGVQRRPLPGDETSYDVTATYVGRPGQSCLLTDYPVITVAPRTGTIRRPLHPAGGVITGYGQPAQATIAFGQPAYSSLLVKGTDCKGEQLRNLRFEQLLVVSRLSKWCELDESYWLTKPNGKLANKGAASGCHPYDLTAGGFTATKVGGTKTMRYTFTIQKKRKKQGAADLGCELIDFPHLSARTSGSLHELPVRVPAKSKPALRLLPGATATAYIDVPAKSCGRGKLSALRVENLLLKNADKELLTIDKWCTITEAYWEVLP